MKRVFVNLCIASISIILTFLMLEGAVRYRLSHHLNYDYEMWRYATELKEPLADPRLPFHHKANAYGKFYGVDIGTNSIGLRDVEYKIPKPPGKKRVLVLGDSFVLGWGVSLDDTLTKQLEKKLLAGSRIFEVVNMGTGNYNSSMEVELFKRKGLMLEPDIVVLMYYINDTEPTPEIGGSRYSFLRYFYLPAYISARLKQLGMMHESNDWLHAYYNKLYAPNFDGFRKGKEAIKELVRITAENRIKLLIVNIPDLRRLKEYPFGFATALPQVLAESNAVPFLDLLPFFSKYDGRFLWVSKDDSHMNSLANSIAAQAIFEKMVREKILE